jgi:hypothetical protein
VQAACLSLTFGIVRCGVVCSATDIALAVMPGEFAIVHEAGRGHVERATRLGNDFGEGAKSTSVLSKSLSGGGCASAPRIFFSDQDCGRSRPAFGASSLRDRGPPTKAQVHNAADKVGFVPDFESSFGWKESGCATAGKDRRARPPSRRSPRAGEGNRQPFPTTPQQ